MPRPTAFKHPFRRFPPYEPPYPAARGGFSWPVAPDIRPLSGKAKVGTLLRALPLLRLPTVCWRPHQQVLEQSSSAARTVPKDALVEGWEVPRPL